MNPISNRRVSTTLFVWLILACGVGSQGRLAQLNPPLPQAIVLGLAALLLAFERWVSWFRLWVAAVDIRAFAALHVTRLFVGVAFLVLGRQGQLPLAFSVPAGWGDVVVGILAGALVVSGGANTSARHKLYHAWNLLGFVDLLAVIANAAHLSYSNPAAMAELTRFPMSLVPTFLVPILLATHAWIFLKLGTEAPSDGG